MAMTAVLRLGPVTKVMRVGPGVAVRKGAPSHVDAMERRCVQALLPSSWFHALSFDHASGCRRQEVQYQSLRCSRLLRVGTDARHEVEACRVLQFRRKRAN